MHYVIDPTATGPFDIVGDVHGCHNELITLMNLLGYRMGMNVETKRCAEDVAWIHPEGRRLIFVGDLVDRGPNSPSVLEEVYTLCQTGTAMCVLGNHDFRLARKLRKYTPREVLNAGYAAGRPFTHGLETTLKGLARLDETLVKKWTIWLSLLPSYLVLDHDKLVVAHAGVKPEMIGRIDGEIRAFTMYGHKTEVTDENGFKVLYDWAKDYEGEALVVYGHAHHEKAEIVRNTICLDTRCAFGGELSALRYPEREVVTVKAKETYYAMGRHA